MLIQPQNQSKRERCYRYRYNNTRQNQTGRNRFFQKRKGVLTDYRNQSAPIKEEEKVFDFLPELISKMDVWNAIRKMNNERYRQVLVDLELKDLDPKVLAREMNVTVENLYNIRHRAVKQLIAVIREEEHYV